MLCLLLLLPRTALAAPPASEPTLIEVPVVPPPNAGQLYSMQSVPVGRPRPRSDAWTSDYALVTCATDGDRVVFTFHADEADWPYVLPDTVTCRQGEREVQARLALGPPEVTMWAAGDGTIVVPHRPGIWIRQTFAPPPDQLIGSAQVAPAVDGVSCAPVGAGGVEVSVDGDADAGLALCVETMADGTTAIQRIMVVDY